MVMKLLVAYRAETKSFPKDAIREICSANNVGYVIIKQENFKGTVPFDPTIFNADFKPPAAALVEKSWGTNEMRSGLMPHSDYSAWPSKRVYSSASSAEGESRQAAAATYAI